MPRRVRTAARGFPLDGWLLIHVLLHEPGNTGRPATGGWLQREPHPRAQRAHPPRRRAPSDQGLRRADAALGSDFDFQTILISRPRGRAARKIVKKSKSDPRLVAGEFTVVAPVRLLDVLEDDVDLISRRLADPDHRLGDGRRDLAPLLVRPSRVPLDRDVRHDYLRVMESRRSCTTSAPPSSLAL